MNLLMLGLVLYASWRYAVRAQLLREGVTYEMQCAVERRIFVAQALYAGGFALCVFSTFWSIVAIVLLQLNYAICSENSLAEEGLKNPYERSLSWSSNSASAASNICRCRGLQAICRRCNMCCLESSSPRTRFSLAICSGVSAAPWIFWVPASSCCCSTDLLSHPRAMQPF